MLRTNVFCVSCQGVRCIHFLSLLIFACMVMLPAAGLGQQTCNNLLQNGTLDITQGEIDGKPAIQRPVTLIQDWYCLKNSPDYVGINANNECIYQSTNPTLDEFEDHLVVIRSSEGMMQYLQRPVKSDPYLTYTLSYDASILPCTPLEVSEFQYLNNLGQIDVRLSNSLPLQWSCYGIGIPQYYAQSPLLTSTYLNNRNRQRYSISFGQPFLGGIDFNQIWFYSENLTDPNGGGDSYVSINTIGNISLTCISSALTGIEEVSNHCTDYEFRPEEVRPFSSYEWYVDGVLVSNQKNLSYDFSFAGSYELCIKAIDEYGCCAQECKKITVSCPIPNASFLVEGDCPVYKFCVTNQQSCDTYLWDFGDGTTSTDACVDHFFTVDKAYSVKLTVTNCGAQSSQMQTIQVDCNRIPCDQNNGCINIGTPGGTVYLSQLVGGVNPLIPSTIQYFGRYITNQCFNLEGTLVIDLLMITFSNTTWYCGSGSKIVCNDYGAIGQHIFLDSQLEGCSTMWRGIEAKGNGIPDYYSFTSNISLVNTTISDAYRAVEVSSGRSIHAINSRFYNNYVGIYVTPTSTHNQVFTNIDNTTFEYTGTMLPPYIGQPEWAERSYAGIEANDLTRLYVHGDEMNSKSLFRNLSYGIKTARSGVDVTNTTFERTDYQNAINANILYHDYGIYEYEANSYSIISENTFRGALFNGITSTNGRLNGIKISENWFDLGDNTASVGGLGIIIGQSDNINIEIAESNTFDLKNKSTALQINFCNYNTLKIDRNTINNNKIANSEIVYINNSKPVNGNGLIRENIFNGISINGDVYFVNSPKLVVLSNQATGHGVRMLHSNSPNCFFKNNTCAVTATTYEFITSTLSPDSKFCCNSSEADGQWTFLFNFGGDMNQKLVGNTIKNLQLKDGTVIGKQESHGNIFLNNSTAQAKNYPNNLNYFEQNQFIVDNSATGIPATVIPAQYKLNWFDPRGTSATCASKDDCDSEAFELPLIGEDTSWYYLQLELPEGEAIDLASNYAGAASLFADTSWSYRDLHIWNQNVRLYRYIQKNPNLNWTQLLNTTGAGSYFNVALTPAMVQWAEAAQTRESLYQMSYQESKVLHDHHQLIRDVYLQLRTVSDSLSILNLYQELYAAQAHIDSLDVLVAFRTDVAMADMATDIDALNTVFPFLSELKTVWQTDMKRLRYGLASVTNGEWDELRRIAGLCPLEYGSAVYEAIGLLTLHDGMEALALLNEACTPEVAARSSKEPAKVKVYPNPTGGTLYIQHTGIAADHIVITDILGQIRYEADIDTHAGETTIDLSNLPAGVYQYQLLYRKGVKDTGKFIRID